MRPLWADYAGYSAGLAWFRGLGGEFAVQGVTCICAGYIRGIWGCLKIGAQNRCDNTAQAADN